MASNTILSVTCAACSELYTDPRMLQCLHSFCKKCILKLYEEQGSRSLKCPTCERAVSIPETGIDALPQDLRKGYESDVAQYHSKIGSTSETKCDRCIKASNGPAVTFCCNCCEFLCKVCKEDHQSWRKTLNHELIDLASTMNKKFEESFLQNIPHKPMVCALHKDETLKFFCETCKVLICRDCIVLDHKDHQYNRIEKVAEKEKDDLLPSLRDVEAAKATIEDAMAQGEKVMQQVQAKKKSADETIATAFKEVEEALRTRKDALLAKNSEIALAKVTSLTLQNEELKKARDGVATTYQIVSSALETHTAAEILSTKKVMKGRLQELLQECHQKSLEPDEADFLLTSLEAKPLVSQIANFGILTGGCSPSMSTAQIHIPGAIVGKERKITVVARDEQGQPFPHGGECVRGKFSLIGSNDPVPNTDTVDDGNGTYVVKFTPQVAGEHELAVAIHSQPVKGSPFVFHVRQERNYLLLSSCQQYYSVSYPWGVAVHDSGDLLVACYNTNRISVCSTNGTVKSNIGTGQLNCPTSIAVRGDTVYATEESNHSVQKFNITSGTYLSHFGEYGTGEGQLSNPRGICLDPEGRVFVADHSNNRVQVFNADGRFAYSIRGTTSDSNLQNPWGVAFDPSGHLHVTNYGSNCVKIFTVEGKYVTQYGSDTLRSPAGIAIDEEGYSFVAEYYYYSGSYNYIHLNGVLKIFNPQHQFVNSFSGFYYPIGVTIDKDGSIYIADLNNH